MTVSPSTATRASAIAFQWGRKRSAIWRQMDFADGLGEPEVSGMGAAGGAIRNPNQRTRLKSNTIPVESSSDADRVYNSPPRIGITAPLIWEA